jgi:hypothetical protein
MAEHHANPPPGYETPSYLWPTVRNLAPSGTAHSTLHGRHDKWPEEVGHRVGLPHRGLDNSDENHTVAACVNGPSYALPGTLPLPESTAEGSETHPRSTDQLRHLPGRCAVTMRR